MVYEYAPHISLLQSNKSMAIEVLFWSYLYKSIFFFILERMKIGQNITSASSTLWFLQLWITSYFPMFVAKQPKSATTLDQDA